MLLRYKIVPMEVKDDEPLVLSTTSPAPGSAERVKPVMKRVVPDHLLKPMIDIVQGSILAKGDLVKFVIDTLTAQCSGDEKPPSKVQIAKKLDEIAVKESRNGEKKRRWYIRDQPIVAEEVPVFSLAATSENV